MHRTIIAIGCLLSLGFATADADAFCLRKVSGYKDYLVWGNTQIPYYVSDNLTDPKILAAIDAAFATWSGVKCSTLSFSKGGTFKLTAKFQDPGKSGVFIFWFDKQAGFPSKPEYASYTFFGLDAKAKLDVGAIAINEFKYAWATDGSKNALDVQGEITSLIGRVLGLADSDAQSSVMKPSLAFGDIGKRVLQPDDEDAVSYLYPAGGCTKPTAPGANDCNGGNSGSNPTPGAPDGGGGSGGTADGGSSGGGSTADGGGGGGTASPDAGMDDSGSNGGNGGNSGGNGGNGSGGNTNGGCSTSADCPAGSVCTVEGQCVDLNAGNNSGGATTDPVQGGGCSLGPDADVSVTLSVVLLLCGLLLLARQWRRSGI